MLHILFYLFHELCKTRKQGTRGKGVGVVPRIPSPPSISSFPTSFLESSFNFILSSSLILGRFTSVADYVKKLGGNNVITKVLIANNGIAAVKFIRSIRLWAYENFGNEARFRLSFRLLFVSRQWPLKPSHLLSSPLSSPSPFSFSRCNSI